MTRLLAGLAIAALVVLRRLFCGHHTQTSRPMLVHPEDGRVILDCYCEACGARWPEYGK